VKPKLSKLSKKRANCTQISDFYGCSLGSPGVIVDALLLIVVDGEGIVNGDERVVAFGRPEVARLVLQGGGGAHGRRRGPHHLHMVLQGRHRRHAQGVRQVAFEDGRRRLVIIILLGDAHHSTKIGAHPLTSRQSTFVTPQIVVKKTTSFSTRTT
jgi:hypothetical protein